MPEGVGPGRTGIGRGPALGTGQAPFTRLRGCIGERIGAHALGAATGRGRTTCATGAGRICCPVARATAFTGGPKLPPRPTVACGPLSGVACATAP